MKEGMVGDTEIWNHHHERRDGWRYRDMEPSPYQKGWLEIEIWNHHHERRDGWRYRDMEPSPYQKGWLEIQR